MVQKASEATLRPRQSSPCSYKGGGLDKGRGTKTLQLLAEPGLQPHHHMPSATAAASNLVSQGLGIGKAESKDRTFFLLLTIFWTTTYSVHTQTPGQFFGSQVNPIPRWTLLMWEVSMYFGEYYLDVWFLGEQSLGGTSGTLSHFQSLCSEKSGNGFLSWLPLYCCYFPQPLYCSKVGQDFGESKWGQGQSLSDKDSMLISMFYRR